MSRKRSLGTTLVAGAALAGLAACGGRHDEGRAAAADSSQAESSHRLLQELPHAAFIRFEEARGEGLSREAWWIEILQADRDIWMTGAFRSAGRTIPIKEPMPIDEFHELWTWLDGFKLDQLQLVEDSEAPNTDWKRSLVIDVVESKDRRTRVRSAWSRPLLGHPEIVELEKRLQNMLITSSERELQRQTAETDSTLEAQARALADSSAFPRETDHAHEARDTRTDSGS